MKEDGCTDMRLLVQADVDGELGPADTARLGTHIETCADCAALQDRLLSLSKRVRGMPYHAAPDALREAVRARIAALAMAAELSPRRVPATRSPWWARFWQPGVVAPFGAGFALAACLLLLFVSPNAGGGLADDVVASHIRALQPGHLMDVVSTDQHTVKPWFDGRLDYAPPVKNLASAGFPLVGGRLDYLAGRPVGAMIYQRRQHLIDLYAWPEGSRVDRAPAVDSRNGYNFVRWDENGMVFWAVSDVTITDLAEFVRLWQAS